MGGPKSPLSGSVAHGAPMGCEQSCSSEGPRCRFYTASTQSGHSESPLLEWSSERPNGDAKGNWPARPRTDAYSRSQDMGLRSPMDAASASMSVRTILTSSPLASRSRRLTGFRPTRSESSPLTSPSPETKRPCPWRSIAYETARVASRPHSREPSPRRDLMRRSGPAPFGRVALLFRARLPLRPHVRNKLDPTPG